MSPTSSRFTILRPDIAEDMLRNANRDEVLYEFARYGALREALEALLPLAMERAQQLTDEAAACSGGLTEARAACRAWEILESATALLGSSEPSVSVDPHAFAPPAMRAGGA